jgi:hypothetical protein
MMDVYIVNQEIIYLYGLIRYKRYGKVREHFNGPNGVCLLIKIICFKKRIVD